MTITAKPHSCPVIDKKNRRVDFTKLFNNHILIKKHRHSEPLGEESISITKTDSSGIALRKTKKQKANFSGIAPQKKEKLSNYKKKEHK